MHRPKLAKQENYFSKKSDEKILANLIGGDETEVCKSNIVSDSALNPIKIKKCELNLNVSARIFIKKVLLI